MSQIEFNPFSGTFDFVGSGGQQISVDPKTIFTINAGETITVHNLPSASFQTIEYFIQLTKGPASVPKQLSLKVYKSLTQVLSQVYARNSAIVRAELTPVLSGSQYNLQIKNNEAVSIEVCFIKTTL